MRTRGTHEILMLLGTIEGSTEYSASKNGCGFKIFSMKCVEKMVISLIFTLLVLVLAVPISRMADGFVLVSVPIFISFWLLFEVGLTRNVTDDIGGVFNKLRPQFAKMRLIPREYLPNIKYILPAFIAFLFVWFLPNPAGLSVEGQRALAVFALIVILWVTEALPIVIPALMAPVMLTLVGVVEPKNAFLSFGHQAVFFLVGAFLLGAAFMRYDLHKRMALNLIVRFKQNSSVLLLGVILTSAFLSMVMLEHVVAILMLPVAIGITSGFNREVPNFNKSVLLGVAYGCSIGSLGTYLGGARNLLAVSIMEESAGLSISFTEWMIAAIPIVIPMLFFTWLLLRRSFPHEEVDINVATDSLKEQVNALGKMSGGEKKTLAIFLFAIVTWSAFGHTYGLATIALLAAGLLFFTGTLDWTYAEKNVPWGIVLLYGGAIVLGSSLASTGAAEYIAKGAVSAVGTNPYLIIGVLVTITIFLTEVMSNAAAVGMLMPISLGIMPAINFPLIPATFLIALPAGLAFMMIIATPGNAIVYSSGNLSTHDFLRAGIWLNLIGIFTVMTMGLAWWRFLGLY